MKPSRLEGGNDDRGGIRYPWPSVETVGIAREKMPEYIHNNSTEFELPNHSLESNGLNGAKRLNGLNVLNLTNLPPLRPPQPTHVLQIIRRECLRDLQGLAINFALLFHGGARFGAVFAVG